VLFEGVVSTPPRREGVETIKWVASIIQILGYAATAFGMTPWNLYLFIVGVVGWLIVGVFWNDKAIMLTHIVALGAMLAGTMTA